MMMPEKDGFKITNPKAPFIRLVQFLENSQTPHYKYGDVKWLLQNIDILGFNKNDYREVKELLLDLNFMKGK